MLNAPMENSQRVKGTLTSPNTEEGGEKYWVEEDGVIIRNLPSRYPNSALTDMTEQVSKVVSIDEQRRVCRIKLRSADRARKVVEALNGREFYGKKLSVSEGRKNWILGLFFLFLSSSSLSISLLHYSFCSLFSTLSSFSAHHTASFLLP